MKKIYVTPKTNVIKLQLEPIMGIGSTSETQVNQNAVNYSREGDSSFWDDED